MVGPRIANLPNWRPAARGFAFFARLALLADVRGSAAAHARPATAIREDAFMSEKHQITRRQFLAQASRNRRRARLRPRLRARAGHRAHGAARSLSAGRGVGRSRAGQRDPVDASRAGCRPCGASSGGRGRARRGLCRHRRARRCERDGGDRLDLPLSRRRPRARARILVSLRRRSRTHEPRRPHADGACGRATIAPCASRSSAARTSRRARATPTGA